MLRKHDALNLLEGLSYAFRKMAEENASILSSRHFSQAIEYGKGIEGILRGRDMESRDSSFFPSIPGELSIKDTSVGQAIFLDNDEYLLEGYRGIASSFGVESASFSDIKAFWSNYPKYNSKKNNIYIDLNINKDLDGLKILKSLKGKFLGQLFIHTGMPESEVVSFNNESFFFLQKGDLRGMKRSLQSLVDR